MKNPNLVTAPKFQTAEKIKFLGTNDRRYETF
jgi:hypothetical protein